MFETASAYSADKSQFYSQLQQEVAALIDPSLPLVSNLSNISSLLFWAFHDKAVARPVNWVGFYLLPSARKDVLLLGPFHGRVACTTIKLGKGVCGTSAAEKRTILVPDVHAFAGHIACDSASESEIVVPLIHQDGSLLGEPLITNEQAEIIDRARGEFPSIVRKIDVRSFQILNYILKPYRKV
eukprot:jgi/Hompol1/5897/HPOL_000333-RA